MYFFSCILYSNPFVTILKSFSVFSIILHVFDTHFRALPNFYIAYRFSYRFIVPYTDIFVYRGQTSLTTLFSNIYPRPPSIVYRTTLYKSYICIYYPRTTLFLCIPPFLFWLGKAVQSGTTVGDSCRRVSANFNNPYILILKEISNVTYCNVIK